MVMIDGDYKVTSKGTVKCSLIADDLDEVLDMGEGMEIEGLPEQYWDKLELGCDAMDTNGLIMFLQSDGTWNR